MPLPTSDEFEGESPEIQFLLATLDSYTDRFEPHHPLILDVSRRLAIAFWREGDARKALSLLDQALRQLHFGDESTVPLRADLLDVAWRIMFEQRHVEQASRVLREILKCRVDHLGACHPDSLTAQGDLASVLFELGQNEEADALEQEALGRAQVNLGKTHSVTCVPAWNRVLTCERRRDFDSARRVIVGELI